MIRGAGILFITPDRRGLFLKRGPGGDWPGYWCFPGGTTEGDESAEQTAHREAVEELGFMPEFLPNGRLIKHAVTQITTAAAEAPPTVPDQLPPDIVQFTTFIQAVADTFEPRLNGEHIGFAWAPIDDPPQPMHPGCMTALQKFKWNELDIARAIRDGALASPQQYENMWLFAMRITGTGVSFRPKINEYVLRKPEDYLTEEFLARCNGLSVIVQHPKSNKLDSQEYAERNVGSMFLPYLRGDEVWGVAKIYDADTVEMLNSFQLSTSPAVVLFPGEEGGAKFKTEDGATILIEEKPKLLDHLAICVVGVWDKGQAPSGVEVAAIGDDAMAEKAEDKKADAAGGTELDKVLKGIGDMTAKMDDCVKRMDSIHSRMDSIEEDRKKEKADAAEKEKADAAAKADAAKGDAKKGDAADPDKDAKKDAADPDKAKEVVADKKKGDAADPDKDEKKGDAKADSAGTNNEVMAAIKKISDQVNDLTIRVPKPVGDADFRLMADAQVKADSVFAQFGDRAPRPLDGENPRAYRNRLANLLKKHSKTWSGIDIVAIGDEAFGAVETQIYGDAGLAASMPEAVPVGTLRGVTKTLPTGHSETRFYGHPAAWMDQFASTRRFVTKINPIWKEH